MRFERAASPSETRGELLRLLRGQAARRRPGDLLRQYRDDGFVAPGPIDQRLVTALDRLALDSAPFAEALLLSPVAPLGTNSVVAPSSQDRTVSTIRTTEVVSDPTNVLALECATRLGGSHAPVHLATVHQTMRAQSLTGGTPSHSRHFRLFALAAAGRALPDDGFEVDAVGRQLGVFDRFFDACAAELGLAFPGRRAVIRTAPDASALGERIRDHLAARMPHVETTGESLESNYYDGLRVGFGAHDPAGDFVEIADLGRFDWVARLRDDRRLRFVASGLGIQLVPLLFAAAR
ncbi:hypothetical protein [Agromyces sp. NPDC055658]